uniref:Major capsid protein n=1 Tax=Dulem virus 210 TaxID=3145687 RepID=A0AAU8AVH1_9VIRU
MGKQPYVSHTVNGYSRYDLPESKAFTCTPGILYPVRVDFINARDRVKIAQGIDVRSNPLTVPTFNPYTVRLHRFWVPLQLYHPELRTNSSNFDMNELSLNYLRTFVHSSKFNGGKPASNSLLSWLRIARPNPLANPSAMANFTDVVLNGTTWANADSYLAYWDIVRNYYSYSQYSVYSIAWPGDYYYSAASGSSPTYYSNPHAYNQESSYFNQMFCTLGFLDAYFETQFYPGSNSSDLNAYNRSSLFTNIIKSQHVDESSLLPTYPPSTIIPDTQEVPLIGVSSQYPTSPFGENASGDKVTLLDVFYYAHPMAVCPASPDRFSRLLPYSTESNSVSMTSIKTIPQLAIASRLQEYMDLLGAGGSRYSDWLETFFASKIEHVDRPKLLFSASQTVNSQVVMATSETGQTGSSILGQQGGSIAFNTQLGRSQSYYFREPGYLIDMFSIRPVYYWQGIRPDYLRYQGADYFNPVYNDIGYQDVGYTQFRELYTGATTGTPDVAIFREPCFNEFRSSYDEALGDFGANSRYELLKKWIQTRQLMPVLSSTEISKPYIFNMVPTLFVDMTTVNSPFASKTEDNFFVNLSYSVQKKNLVNKTFATRLSDR